RADARAVAHEVLVRAETTDAFADVLLADRLRGGDMSPPDHALATRLVYGALAWQGRLDHHLKGLVRGPLGELDPPVRPALRLGAANNAGGPIAVRTNRPGTGRDALGAELGAAQVTAVPSEWAADGLVIAEGGARLRALPAWREGRLAFQGEASQLVGTLLGLAPGDRLLDVCAAPGGKALQAAALLEGRGLVAALDRRPGGVRRVRDEAVRLGAACVEAAVGDARRPPFARPFDAVLVDAPCSGLGTLRRHPELRCRRR